MLNKLNNEFAFNKNSLNLHAYQQELSASNIANVDTPKYKSVNFNFSKNFQKALEKENDRKNENFIKKTNVLQSNSNHLNDIKKQQTTLTHNNFVSRNKAVNIDLERINFVHNGLQYQADIVFINNKIRNIMNVLQG